MPKPIDKEPTAADPNCDVKVEFSNTEGTISGTMPCPFIDKSDPDHPKSVCIVDFLKYEGYRVTIARGTCPKAVATKGSDAEAMMN
ncbi:MAG: hypothetical protein US75_C0003G0009 [Candidatus Woesebacteria bacterium GW2011_GWC1_38_13]|uniref:Uncharacterized protein n=3 Tax=Candidatus Woeseibacteriota TaxID=1752722 RepID=A0A0G0KYI5_9BACT|nr:MAG: hypothetical protein US67_C0021G0005 [Candidatus Woesebacteria bacterium GW2011_GWD1_38_10]KKQ56722.1 MAG: hypothetical protein US75_C0003G0009 [Candidatus Woesebacteria bacterium GW2011_GWC1_38_13]KKQ83792.1 MAG: hypothetical protein UT06_C0016G0013 [Candidatus Woesebacteria bacterium GW2011_GWA1_38_8]